MKQQRAGSPPSWLNLDNAAKIYPAARSKGWMPMFRVSITFLEDIDHALMQRALDAAVRRVPFFGYRLRRGLFWYYLESQKERPQVEEDARNPMLPLNLTQGRRFLFRLRVHKRRAALEVFHALTDGYGATVFLVTLAAEYLYLRTGKRMEAGGMVLDTRERPRPEEWEDSFPRYARARAGSRREQSAWQLRGTAVPRGFLRVITGLVPTQQLLELARGMGTTINNLLAALLLRSLMRQKEGSLRMRRRPVKLSLPVNLRRYYPSGTLRNFSFYVNVPVHTGQEPDSLEGLIDYLTHYMGLETMEHRLNVRFSANVKAERNKLLRVAPLFLKTLVLKIMYRFTGERYVTTTLTNLGRIALPQGMEEQVERMNLVLGPARRTPLGCAVISAAGQTCISFSKSIRETEVERDFFTSLVQLGIPVTIQSN